MNEAAQQSLEELQSAVLTLGVAALALISFMVIFVMAKRMLSSSAKWDNSDFDEAYARKVNQWARYHGSQGRGTNTVGPKGHLP